MSWKDFGLIFRVNNLFPWALTHCYVPTALELASHIRIYASFWYEKKCGRLGYIDVDKDNPTQILNYSLMPIMSDSSSAAFDYNGVTPLSVIQDDTTIRLYYAGWKRFSHAQKRYTIYTGLALSEDEGETFKRYADIPIMGKRSDSELIRSGGFTMRMHDHWRTWLASYSQNVNNPDKVIPSYNLETMVSKDGIHWPANQQVVFSIVPDKILGYGRSAIWIDTNQVFNGLFSVRSWNGKYYGIYHATSHDGLTWSNLTLDGMGFSSKNTCDEQSEVAFPSLIHQKDRMLMFYNGDDFGCSGLRLAIWS